MSGYGMGGYVGSSEDSRRIRRQQEQREKERAEYEAAKKQSGANVDAAGLRKFDTGSSEVRRAQLPQERAARLRPASCGQAPVSRPSSGA